VLGGCTNSYFGEDLSQFFSSSFHQGGIEYTEEGDDVFVKAGANVVWDDLCRRA
jgi:hypothetical protein